MKLGLSFVNKAHRVEELETDFSVVPSNKNTLQWVGY